MGDGPVEIKDSPEYDLESVKELVRQCSDGNNTILFAGTRINNDLAKMGWTPDDVPNALLSLTEDHYDGSLRYDGPVTSWHDVYLLTHEGANGNVYDLYIKIRLTVSRKMVVVCSFHPEGWE